MTCNKLVEKAGGEGGLGGYSKSMGTGMDDGMGFIFHVNDFFRESSHPGFSI